MPLDCGFIHQDQLSTLDQTLRLGKSLNGSQVLEALEKPGSESRLNCLPSVPAPFAFAVSRHLFRTCASPIKTSGCLYPGIH